MSEKIFVSGMNSGQNPSSGLGIARSIRKAFPRSVIVGVDHTQASTGLHDAAIDEILLLPRWDQIHDETHAERVRKLLDDGNLWIASMDMEVHWFSENLGRHANLIAPGGSMLDLTAKPAVPAFRSMGFRVPEFVPASLPDSEIHSFLRHHSWQCWLKSPYHDAKRVSSWGTFSRSRDYLSQNWKTSKLFLQRHVVGNEETIAFSAYQGELLGAAHLEKRQLTPEGKTWAGRVTPVDPETWERIRDVVKTLGWSGGGELEFVRDSDGEKWIIECNPRYPAWIYGAALAGNNIVAKLVSHVWDMPFLESVSHYPFFTRVVNEIPARESVGIPLPQDPSAIAWAGDGKHGKSGPGFSELLPNLAASRELEDEQDERASLWEPERIPETMREEVGRIASSFEGETPARIFLRDWSKSRFESLAARISDANTEVPRIQVGYSVKTSPTDDHLRRAKESGFFAECISQMEVRRSLDFGFPAHQVILNGPGKFWPLSAKPATGLHMLFCDSVEEFERVLEIPGIARVLGFRARLPKIQSRFGSAVGDFEGFRKMVSCIRRIEGRHELGFHFHMPSWSIGVKRWMDALQSLLFWCHTVEELGGVTVKHLDLGGGFFPEDLGKLDFKAIQRTVRSALPGVASLYFEPGRALTQETEILVSRVLDVREGKKDTPTEIVVDACIAELPLAQAFPHRVFYRPQSGDPRCAPLKKGDSRILGRICMEDDILCSDVELPESPRIGDLVVFGDAGGYERSMSYGFGRG